MSTYSTNLAIELIGTGEQAGAWGSTTNTNLGTLIEQAISGYVTQAITDGADTVITIPNAASGVARNMSIECTGTLTAARNLIVPANRKLYFIYNNTSGNFAVTVKVSGLTGVSVPNGKKMVLVSNGTDIVVATNYMVGDILGNATNAVTQAVGTNNTTIATTAFVQAALQALHPVGSVYINATNNANPGTLLGFGTWTAFGAGRVPVGFDSTNTLFDTAEEIGGSANAVVVGHSHLAVSIVTDPGHFHNIPIQNDFGYPDGSGGARQGAGAVTSSATTGITVATGIGYEGVSGTDANYQPYITVYMWKRTA
jgi:hypothetical protein